MQVPLGMLWLDGDDADRAENLAAQEVFGVHAGHLLGYVQTFHGRLPYFTDIVNGVETSWNILKSPTTST